MSDSNIIKRTTTVVTVGRPPDDDDAFEGWEFVEVYFYGFEDLPSARNDCVESPQFECFGRQWRLDMYPGGINSEANVSEEGKISIFLAHCSKGSIDINDLDIVAKSSDGKEVKHWSVVGDEEFLTFCHEGSGDGDDIWGRSNFAKRSKIIDVLVEGTLVIEVRMKLEEARDTPVPPFVPENPLCQLILKKFMDQDSADVIFEVGSKSVSQGRGASKRAKKSPNLFYAHHLILQGGAQPLADLCALRKDSAPVQITDVRPDIFRHLLYYVYGGRILEEELKANAKDVIDAADKYGVVNLKLEAEACHAKFLELSTNNVLDNLLYAHAKNCALLKEVVIDFMTENSDAILGKVSFDDVPGSVVSDLLTATARRNNSDSDINVSDKTMRVSALRKKLHEKGLDIDGSRETMVALLEENS
mmetsp:Transcript_15833/g.38052  ORF Transcript_15833/g.38052 Transcript_15833/m.38052 type:complete len:417 (+) Transcript_15833:65-1315(+)